MEKMKAKMIKLILRLLSFFETIINFEMKKINQKTKKKENMFSNPTSKFPQRVFMKIFLQKQIMPSTLDKLILLTTEGKSFCKKRNIHVNISFTMRHFYRLLHMKNPGCRPTTSREATPMGDPRGVPKQFSTFWKFSKQVSQISSKSLPICLEGFRNRSKHSYQSVIQRIEVNKSVTILVFKAKIKPRYIQINLDISKMEQTNNPFMDDLLGFLESPDITLTGDAPTMDLDELFSSLPSENSDKFDMLQSSQFSSSQSEEFVFPDATGLDNQGEIVTESSEAPLILQEVTSTDVNRVTATDAATPIFTISTSLPSQPISFPKCVLQIIPGTNTYQLVPMESPNVNTVPLAFLSSTQSLNTSVDASTMASPVVSIINESSVLLTPPSPISSSSANIPISPSSSSSSSFSPVTDDYRLMRDKNNKASKEYRERKKTKQQLADEELEKLEKENEILNMKVKQMEIMNNALRERVITNISQPFKRRANTDDDDDEDSPEVRRRRWEP